MTRSALLLVLAGCLSTPSRPLAGDARGADAAIDTPTFTTRHWVKPAYQPGPAVNFTSLAYDSDRHEVLRYGGETVSGDPNDASMSRLTPSGWAVVCDPCMPGGRAAPSFAYDPVRHVAVLVGGFSTGTTFADKFFYEWDGNAWTKTATQLPAARASAQLVFDPSRGKLVLIGGEDNANSKSDAFAYDGALTPLPSLLGSVVANNGGATATYDTTNMRIVVATGSGINSSTGGDELWALGSAAASWTAVCSSCGAWRTVPAIQYDPVLRRLILIGGNPMSGGLIDGTWALVSNVWTMVDANPPGRESPAMVYDASRDTIVIYGGSGSNTECPGNGNCNVTWEMVPN